MRWLQKTRWAMMLWQPNPSNFRFPGANVFGSLGRITCNAPAGDPAILMSPSDKRWHDQSARKCAQRHGPGFLVEPHEPAIDRRHCIAAVAVIGRTSPRGRNRHDYTTCGRSGRSQQHHVQLRVQALRIPKVYPATVASLGCQEAARISCEKNCSSTENWLRPGTQKDLLTI